MTRPIAFSGNLLDRDERHRRDAAHLAKALQDEATRVLPVWKGAPLVREGAEKRLAWATPAILEGHGGPEPVFLGMGDGRAHFAVDLSAHADPLAEFGWAGAASFPDLRGTVGLLAPSEGGIAAQARHIVDWHARHGFCPGCGARTRPKDGGWARVCTACATEHFPRTDPVVIMLVADGDRCLLGRQVGWPVPMFSALAGYVEAGETIEEGVRREVREEAGVEVGAIRYVASQPWPFPASLMIGCEAEAVTQRIVIDPNELEAADWFTRDEVRAAFAGPTARLGVPPPIAIAHHLLRAWVDRSSR
jgi:NAD+ diphosphatase